IAFCALLPGLGVLTVEDLKRVNLLPVFFVASALGMGEVLNQTKALSILTNFMFAWMEPLLSNVFVTTIVLYWTAFRDHFLLDFNRDAVTEERACGTAFEHRSFRRPLFYLSGWRRYLVRGRQARIGRRRRRPGVTRIFRGFTRAMT